MKKLLASLALCLPFYLIAQGFGIFGKDQPYFAADSVSDIDVPCDFFDAWNPTTNINQFAIYDFNCLSGSDGTVITNVDDYNDYQSHDLTSTNGPYLTNNSSEINNRKYVKFNGTNNYLMNSASDAYAGSNVTFIVARFEPNSASVVHTLFDNGRNNIQPSPGIGQQLWSFNDGTYTYGGATGAEVQRGPFALTTNWMVYEMYWTATGPNSYVKTNGVFALSSGDAGDTRRVGVAFGCDRIFTQFGKVNVAFAALYTNTLDTTTSSNIFFYLTNRFNIHN